MRDERKRGISSNMCVYIYICTHVYIYIYRAEASIP